MADDPNTPPWGEEANFDPQRAWTLIQNLRSENSQIKNARDQAVAERDQVRDELTTKVSELTTQNEELQATVQLTDDTVKERDTALNSANSTIMKHQLLSDAKLPLRYVANVSGTTEDEWKASVSALAELQGSSGIQRVPDPAQVANPDDGVSARDRAAADFFNS